MPAPFMGDVHLTHPLCCCCLTLDMIKLKIPISIVIIEGGKTKFNIIQQTLICNFFALHGGYINLQIVDKEN
jgi:hypothetical protein